MKLLFMNSDDDFKRRFSRYISSECHPVTIELCTGGCDDICIDGYDLVITDEETAPEVLAKLRESGKEYVQLTSQKSMNESQLESGQTGLSGVIYKYQSAKSILRQIPSLYMLSAGELGSGGSSTAVTVVSGFHGGSGKTSFTMMLARMCRQMLGKRTLVISTSQMSDIYEYFGDIEGKENIMSLAVAFSLNSSVDIRRFIVEDGHGVCAIRQQENYWSSIHEMKEEEIKLFVNCLCSSGMFDIIIFDLDNEIADINHYICSIAEKVFLLSRPGEKPVKVMNSWEKYYTSGIKKENIIRVENMYEEYFSPEIVFYYDEADDSGADYHLPDDSESFYVKNGICEISMTGRYAAAVSEICIKELGR